MIRFIKWNSRGSDMIECFSEVKLTCENEGTDQCRGEIKMKIQGEETLNDVLNYAVSSGWSADKVTGRCLCPYCNKGIEIMFPEAEILKNEK